MGAPPFPGQLVDDGGVACWGQELVIRGLTPGVAWCSVGGAHLSALGLADSAQPAGATDLPRGVELVEGM